MAGQRAFIEKIFASADIKINGDRPWDIRVTDDRLFERVLADGSMGLGESYMDGWWDARSPDAFFTRLLAADLDRTAKKDWHTLLYIMGQTLINQQFGKKAYKIGKHHYDLGNDLFRATLDARLVYTSAYWQGAATLDQAQENKLDLVCRKLRLEPGQKILDIGCGWGSFAKFAAERYRVSVVGITVSQEQVKLGRELCAGLPIEILLLDYHDIQGEFDHIVSLGMFEHVGHKNYRDYMTIVNQHLKADGLFLLHTIGSSRSVTGTDPWIAKYIFPNSSLPSIKQIGRAIEGLFVMEDWHNFSADYDKTLMAWLANFERNWPTLKDKYDQRFFRMWKYFLCASAAGFRSRKNQLWQIVMSKRGVVGGYQSIR